MLCQLRSAVYVRQQAAKPSLASRLDRPRTIARASAVEGYQSRDGPAHQVILSKNSKYFDVCLADTVEDACWVNDWADRVSVDVTDVELPAALAVFEHIHTDALPTDPQLLAQMCIQAHHWQMEDTFQACLAELLNHQLANPREILTDDHLRRTFVSLPYDIVKPWFTAHPLSGPDAGAVAVLLGMWTARQRAAAGGEVTQRLAAQLADLSA